MMIIHSRLVGCLVMLLVVSAGCVAAPTSPAGAAATAGASTSSTAAAPPSAKRTPHPAATDIDPGGTAAPEKAFGPDEFWARTGGTDMVATFDSEAALLRAADLVVVGTLDRYEKGPTLKVSADGTLAYFSQMTLSVDQVVRGKLVSAAGAPDTVGVIALLGFDWDQTRFSAYAASAPIGKRVVLFLYNSVAATIRGEEDPKTAGVGPEVYVMLNGSQAWIRDDGGAARVYAGEAASTWATAMAAGRSFDDVVKGLVGEAAKIK